MTPDLGELQALLDQSQVSTASLNTEDARTAPATIVTITAEDLRRYGIQTLSEALNFLTLGFVTESRLDYSDVGARGVTFTSDYGVHMLMMLDGHALNEQWSGGAYVDQEMGIPLELIDHIEVILGPGSVLYGSNAMLGVINVVTKNGRTVDGGYATVESNVPNAVRASVGYGRELRAFGADGEVVLGAMLYHSHGPAVTLGPQDYGVDSVTGELRRFTDDDVGTGVWGGTVEHARHTDTIAVLSKVALGDFAFDVHASTTYSGTPISVYGNFDDPNNWERDRWLQSDLRWHRTLSRIAALDARLYGDHYEYYQQLETRAAENCLEGQTDGCNYRLAGAADWGGLDTHATFDWRPDGSLTTVAGFDARGRAISSWEEYVDHATSETVPTDDYQLGEGAVGVYAEQTARVGKWLGANVGARFDADTRFGSHLSPRAALSLTPVDGTVVKVLYSEAFRAPTAFERYYADPGWWVESDGLTAEVVRSIEGTVEQDIGDQHVLAGVFASQWSDMVTETQLTDEEVAAAIAAGELGRDVVDAYQYESLGASRSYGANAAWKGTAFDRHLSYGATVTVADWVNRTDVGYAGPGDNSVAPKAFGNARIAYDPGGGLPVFAMAARFVGPRWVDYSEFDPYPAAPPNVEVRAALSGTVPHVDALTWRLAMSRVTSTETPFAAGPLSAPTDTYTKQETVPIDPFTVLAGVQYRFARDPQAAPR